MERYLKISVYAVWAVLFMLLPYKLEFLQSDANLIFMIHFLLQVLCVVLMPFKVLSDLSIVLKH